MGKSHGLAIQKRIRVDPESIFFFDVTISLKYRYLGTDIDI